MVSLLAIILICVGIGVAILRTMYSKTACYLLVGEAVVVSGLMSFGVINIIAGLLFTVLYTLAIVFVDEQGFLA